MRVTGMAMSGSWAAHHIATRHYDDRDPITRECFDLQGYFYRKPDSEFSLLIAGDLPANK